MAHVGEEADVADAPPPSTAQPDNERPDASAQLAPEPQRPRQSRTLRRLAALVFATAVTGIVILSARAWLTPKAAQDRSSVTWHVTGIVDASAAQSALLAELPSANGSAEPTLTTTAGSHELNATLESRGARPNAAIVAIEHSLQKAGLVEMRGGDLAGEQRELILDAAESSSDQIANWLRATLEPALQSTAANYALCGPANSYVQFTLDSWPADPQSDATLRAWTKRDASVGAAAVASWELAPGLPLAKAASATKRVPAGCFVTTSGGEPAYLLKFAGSKTSIDAALTAALAQVHRKGSPVRARLQPQARLRFAWIGSASDAAVLQDLQVALPAAAVWLEHHGDARTLHMSARDPDANLAALGFQLQGAARNQNACAFQRGQPLSGPHYFQLHLACNDWRELRAARAAVASALPDNGCSAQRSQPDPAQPEEKPAIGENEVQAAFRAGGVALPGDANARILLALPAASSAPQAASLTKSRLQTKLNGIPAESIVGSAQLNELAAMQRMLRRNHPAVAATLAID